MPIDINELRSYKGGDPELWRRYQRQRFKSAEIVDEVLKLDEKWRDLTNEEAKLRRDANQLQTKVIAPKKKAKEKCEEEVKELKEIQSKIKEIQSQIPCVATERDDVLKKIGNKVDEEVPISQHEDTDSLVVSLSPIPPEGSEILPAAVGQLRYTLPSVKPFQHDYLLWRIDGYEPVRGQNIAGHRAYFLKNSGVLLNQALINYGIAFLRKRGYEVLQPPYFMNKDVMSEIAQLEDFDEQLYKVSGKTDDPDAVEKYLIATSEQPICGYHKGEWMDENKLPLRYAGLSTCFRKEAGSSGKDIRGIFRVHQFDKIEQFCLTKDDYQASSNEHKHMLQTAEDFYKSLDIPYRTLCLVSGELNDAAVKKYDIEGWFPGQNTYRELVSCSNCTDYQARGVGTRCGTKKGKGATGDALKEKASYCHMLNATLCATGRVICCLLENYQTQDGVKVPHVLVPYMGGIDFLPFVRDPMDITKGEKAAKKHAKNQTNH